MESGEQKLETTAFFIEANSYEKLCLWREHHKEYGWEEDNSGIGKTIGFINDDPNKPVVLNFFFAKIFGKRICFYEATSRFVDHTMIEEWIEKNYPITWRGTSRAMTDAMNFHHAVDHCRTLAEMK
jgi:hypothetical protein